MKLVGYVAVCCFLDTAYYDNVFREKEKYENQIVGLIDIEYELEERTVCSRGTGFSGIIWHIAVHPDFRRMKISDQLLNEAEKLAKEFNLNRLEAWIRDNLWVQGWYEKSGFVIVDSYLHVYSDHTDEIKGVIKSNIDQLYPVQTFAHYTGENKEEIRKQFKRVHDCFCFEKYFS